MTIGDTLSRLEAAHAEFDRIAAQAIETSREICADSERRQKEIAESYALVREKLDAALKKLEEMYR